MKYAYIVTRIVTGNRPGTVDIPNLGVHSNLKSAQKHYKSILKDRASIGCYVRHFSPSVYEGKRMLVNEARIDYSTAKYDQDKVECLQLERWVLK